ncbi:adenine nucleotide alpha hydrolase family protein [Pedococcus soli]
MLDFLLIWDRDGIQSVKAAEERIRREAGQLRLTPEDLFRAWYSRDGHVSILVWGSDVPPIKPQDRVERGEDGLRLFLGWMMDPLSGRVVDGVRDTTLDPDTEMYGEYAALRAKPEGDIIIWRNLLASVQLYYSDEPGRFVASTRASMACYGRTLSTRFDLDPAFARTVLTSSIALNDHTLFAGVWSLPQAHTIYRPPGGRPVVHREHDQPLHDEELKRLYINDRKTYWDDAFERITSLAGALDSGDLPIVVPLSGGKDSRLLLGLLTASGRAERIESMLTWGATGSPDIRAATAVAEVLGLSQKHEFRINSAPAPRVMRRAKFLQHAFVTEGEMSPMDLTAKNPLRHKIQLHGQEGGLRNIAGKRRFETSQELLQWFRVHLANWDTCKILTDDARQTNEDEFLGYFSHQLRVVDDLEQIPTKHRSEHRIRRWMARTWGVYNSMSSAPYLLATDTVLKATYNAGPRSRSLEEFHYEMLKRSHPQLLEIPFADQTWDPELETLTGIKPPAIEPFVWNEEVPVMNRRPIHAALRDCFDDLRGLVVSRRPSVLEGVVDLDRLMTFDAAAMKPGHVQPLLHLLTFLGADAVSSFAELDTISDQVGSFLVPDFDSEPEVRSI